MTNSADYFAKPAPRRQRMDFAPVRGKKPHQVIQKDPSEALIAPKPSSEYVPSAREAFNALVGATASDPKSASHLHGNTISAPASENTVMPPPAQNIQIKVGSATDPLVRGRQSTSAQSSLKIGQGALPVRETVVLPRGARMARSAQTATPSRAQTASSLASNTPRLSSRPAAPKPKSSIPIEEAELGVIVSHHSDPSAPVETSRSDLGKMSPFFLKSVKVDKRPLSQKSEYPGPAKPATKSTTEPTKLSKPAKSTKSDRKSTAKAISKPSKSDRKSAKLAKKSQTSPQTSVPRPAAPTVVVPAARKSKAGLIFLTIVTILLGAAVGAAAYLCFFQ